MTPPDNGEQPEVAAAEQDDVLTTMPAAMTGRASPAKAAVGDKPVFAYIGSLPQPQRSIAERVDALAAETLPGLQRSVKWGMAWYGVGDGWCFSCGGFAGHVKLTFGRGTSLTPVPPVTPRSGWARPRAAWTSNWLGDLDERQVASWMTQAAAIPGFGKRCARSPGGRFSRLTADRGWLEPRSNAEREVLRGSRSDPLTPRPCESARRRGGRPRGGRPLRN